MLSRSSDRCDAASSKTSTTPGPRDFATYIAASASRSMALAVVAPRAPSTPPMLAETITRSSSELERPSQRADQAPPDLGHVVADSRSRRARPRTRRRRTGPAGRRARRPRCSRTATCCRSSSPASWPSRSLTALKPSRSQKSSPTRGAVRRGPAARPAAARRARRLARPVSGSRVAWLRSSCKRPAFSIAAPEIAGEDAWRSRRPRCRTGGAGRAPRRAGPSARRRAWTGTQRTAPVWTPPSARSVAGPGPTVDQRRSRRPVPEPLAGLDRQVGRVEPRLRQRVHPVLAHRCDPGIVRRGQPLHKLARRPPPTGRGRGGGRAGAPDWASRSIATARSRSSAAIRSRCATEVSTCRSVPLNAPRLLR